MQRSAVRSAVQRPSKKPAEHFSILKRTYPEYEVEEEKQIFKALSSTPHSHFCIFRWFKAVFLSSASSQDDLLLVVMDCVSNSPGSLFPLEFDCVNLQKSRAGERMLPLFTCCLSTKGTYKGNGFVSKISGRGRCTELALKSCANYTKLTHGPHLRHSYRASADINVSVSASAFGFECLSYMVVLLHRKLAPVSAKHVTGTIILEEQNLLVESHWRLRSRIVMSKPRFLNLLRPVST